MNIISQKIDLHNVSLENLNTARIIIDPDRLTSIDVLIVDDLQYYSKLYNFGFLYLVANMFLRACSYCSFPVLSLHIENEQEKSKHTC